MQIEILNPILQTQIFSLIFVMAILISIRKKPDKEFFPISLTNELKGVAILAVVFSHIGYFLATDTRFLFPLSILAGVGVDMFLFLSGYGLAVSAIKKTLSPVQFYLKRVIKIFIPMWFVLIAFFSLDWFILHQTYPIAEVAQSFIGFFKEADLFGDVNSPLWFITLLLFYYLVFPLVFKKDHPILSALVLFFGGYFLIDFNFETVWRVNHLHRLHFMAFPLGVVFAGLVVAPKVKNYIQVLRNYLSNKEWLVVLSKLLLASIAFAGFLYFGINSGVGQEPWLEQNIKIITVLSIVILFLLKPFSLRFFSLVGIYSYEIYLLHWPIMYRYDIFYAWLPAGVATACYIGLFVLLGFGLQKLTGLITKYLPFTKG